MRDLPRRAIERIQIPRDEETVLLEWTVHLLRRDPARARVVIVAAAIILSSLLGVLIFRSALFALLGPLLLFSSTSEYLLPIRYRITSRRACAAYGAARLEIGWDRVKRVDYLPGSAKLSPFTTPNRLENFRGVLLRFAPDGEPGSREDVTRIVEARMLGSETRALAGGEPAAEAAS